MIQQIRMSKLRRIHAERAFLSRALAELRLRAGEDFIVSSDTLRGSDEMKMLSGSEKLCRALTKVPCAGGPWEWIAETSIPLSSVFPAKHLNFAGCLGCCEVNCCKSRLPGFNPDAFSAEQSALNPSLYPPRKHGVL